MAKGPEITEKQLTSAVTNYTECLALPPAGNQILVITDQMSRESDAPLDPNLTVRVQMASMLIQRLGRRFPTRRLGLSNAPKEDLHNETERALTTLDNEGTRDAGGERTTTVVYIGDAWSNRRGMYDAINEFCEGQSRGSVRVAGSLGFTTGDCRVMSEMDGQRRDTISAASRYFRDFFNTHPQGRLEITSGGKSQYSFGVSYDVRKAPFETELGRFDPDNLVFNGKFVYVNIPGGESFATPFPYRESEGRFEAEGIVFSAKDGLVVSAEEVRQGATSYLIESSKLLLRLVQGGRHIPVAELGLGFYALARIATYEDCSILSKEKAGPHIGIGHGYTTVEEKDIDEAAGDFHHTDFVITSPTIMYRHPSSGELKQLYPSLNT